MAADERAREGVFMAFQYPVEIPGVNNAYFLKAALNATRKQQGLDELDAMDFMTLVKEKVEAAATWTRRCCSASVNEGFSGGEKKRNEIFHMAVLEPTLAILDETDSGLDIDALRVVVRRRQRHAQRRSASFIVVTHYQRLLELHRARLRARAERRPHRQVRRHASWRSSSRRRATAGSRSRRSTTADAGRSTGREELT